MIRTVYSGYLLCLFAVTIWGATFTVTKQLLTTVPPMLILLVRFLVGYAALWVLAPNRLPWQGIRAEVRLALAGILGVTFYFLLENLALEHGGAGMVSVVVCTSPVLTAFFSRLIGRGNPLRIGYWLGFLLAASGVLLTVSQGHLSTLKGAWQGAALAASGAVAWALYTLTPQTLREKSSKVAVTRRTFFWGILGMLPFCLLEIHRWSLAPLLVWSSIWRLLALGIVAGALCYVAWNIAVTRLGGVRATLFLYLNPIVGVLVAAAVLHEPLTGCILLGVALTLLGVLVSTWATRTSH